MGATRPPASPDTTTSDITVAILTIIREEFDAVREIFALTGPKQDSGGWPYYEGRLAAPESPVALRIVCYQAMERGNHDAFIAAEHVLHLWHPSCLMLVGIAGGLSGRDVTQVGDVVAANDVAYYEMVKETAQGRYDRSPRCHPPTPRFLLAARCLEDGDSQWWDLIPRSAGDPMQSPRLVIGQIACGEKILSDPGSSDLAWLKATYQKAEAVEMEAYGTAKAVLNYSAGHVEFGVVRGISDFCDSPKSQEQRDTHKRFAATSAAVAARVILAAMHIARLEPAASLAGSGQLSALVQKCASECARTLGDLYFGSAKAQPADAESAIYDALRTLMRALVREGGLLPASPIDRVVQALPEEYKHLASLRWRATRSALEGDLLGAAGLLELAKADAAQHGSVGDWVLRDMIQDQRLVESSQFNRGDDSARQRLLLLEDELQRLRAWSARSPQNYDLYRLGSKFLEETVKTELTGERTLTLGSALPYRLEEVSEALVTGICLGSYNQITKARQVLAELLIHFGLKEGDPDLLREAVRVMAIEWEQSKLESFLHLHGHRVSPCARLDFLTPGVRHLQPSTQPELCRAQCIVLRHLGDYVRDEELPDVVEFLDRCYKFDAHRGFAARVMREALEALPCVAPRADPNWVMALAYPLLDDHPIVAGEALDALLLTRLSELPEQDLRRLTDALLLRFNQPMPGHRLGLALSVARASPDCATRLAEAYRAAWRDSKSAESIVFTTERNLPADRGLIAAMGTEVVGAIDAANARTATRTQIEYGGFSRWQLMSAVLAAGWECDEDGLVILAETVLRNRSQSSSEKRDCLEAFLGPASVGEPRALRLTAALAPRLADSLSDVLAAKGQALPFGATRTELSLLTTTLLAATGHWPAQRLLDEAAQAARHQYLDTRLAAANAIARSLQVQPVAGLLASWSLLRVLACDTHYEVRMYATHGLGAVAQRDDTYKQPLAEALEGLSVDIHPQVRAAVTRVAAAWPREAWARRLMSSAAGDPNFRVRRVAEEVCREDPAS